MLIDSRQQSPAPRTHMVAVQAPETQNSQSGLLPAVPSVQSHWHCTNLFLKILGCQLRLLQNSHWYPVWYSVHYFYVALACAGSSSRRWWRRWRHSLRSTHAWSTGCSGTTNWWRMKPSRRCYAASSKPSEYQWWCRSINWRGKLQTVYFQHLLSKTTQQTAFKISIVSMITVSFTSRINPDPSLVPLLL